MHSQILPLPIAAVARDGVYEERWKGGILTHALADPLPSTHPLSLRHKEQPFQMSSPRLHRHALTADRSVVGTRCRECLRSWSETGGHERTDAVMGETTELICSNHRFTHTTAQTTQILLFGYLDTRKRKDHRKSRNLWHKTNTRISAGLWRD